MMKMIAMIMQREFSPLKSVADRQETIVLGKYCRSKGDTRSMTLFPICLDGILRLHSKQAR